MQVVVKNIITHYSLFETPNSKWYLVILPGWKNGANSWEEVAKALSQKYKVLTLDFPGFGFTSKPGAAWDIYAYAEFTKKFLEKLEVKECILLGHSFGGRVALILTGDEKYSENIEIKKLILVDSAGLNSRSAVVKLKISLALLAKKILPARISKKLGSVVGSKDYKEAGEMQGILNKVVNQNLLHLLPKIKVPTLIVWGDKDRELSVKETKIFKEKIADSLVKIVWGAGHHPHLDKPETFLDILKEWLC